MSFNILVILASFLLLTFLIFCEVRRSNKHLLFLRILASLILVISVAYMILPISYTAKSAQKRGTLNLITEGVSSIKSVEINGKKFYTDPNLPKAIKQRANFIPDLGYYLADHPEINTINVYGYGLEEDDLRKIQNKALSFFPMDEPAGFIDANWNDQPNEGDELQVQGRYKNLSSKDLQLKLLGFGTTLDSATVKGNSTSHFNLKHQIRQKGKAVLQLLALAGKDTLSREIVPIQSIPRMSGNILMLTSFPAFEYNFLKKWLFENQFPVALRMQISKNKYSMDFFNQGPINLNNINTNLLKNQDVLIINQQEFESLSLNEKNSINQSINQGLGLILFVDDEKSNLYLLKNLKIINKHKADKLFNITLSNKKQKLSSLPTEQQLYLFTQNEQQEIASIGDGQSIVLQQIQGNGKLIFSTLQSSYEWVLAGRTSDYASYWSELISAAARKKDPVLLVNNAAAFPLEDEKQTINIEMPNNESPKVTYEGKELRVNQNLLYPNIWTVQSWAAAKGWNQIEVNGKDFSFFIYGKADWSDIKVLDKIENNLRYAKKSLNNGGSEAKVIENVQIAISKWFFIIGIVICCSFLWLENRLQNKNP